MEKDNQKVMRRNSMCYVGDSFSSDTWCKLEPTGKITTLTAGLYRIMDDDKHFS